MGTTLMQSNCAWQLFKDMGVYFTQLKICQKEQFKVGVKGCFQSFIEFAFSVLLETRKSICTI